jgi:Transposase DDE domain
VPFKAKAVSRHHIPKQARRVTNRAAYDASLRQRGSLTVWFSEDAIAGWRAEGRTTPGGQPHYSALAILTGLCLRAVFRLALRQTEGLIGSIVGLLGLDLAVPDHTTLCRRADGLDVPRPQSSPGAGGMHLIVDSTGLKFHGPGEWLVEKHGTRTRRSWRTLHIGLDADTGRIVAAELTTNDVDDGSQVGPLLDQVAGAVASFTADGAYDTGAVSAAVAGRHPDAAIIVPPRSTAMLSDTAQTNPTQRDRHLQGITNNGRVGWQKSSGYNKRSRAEAAIGRFKQVIGNGLHSQTNARQNAEIAVAVHVLNRMLEFGRPTSVRIV